MGAVRQPHCGQICLIMFGGLCVECSSCSDLSCKHQPISYYICIFHMYGYVFKTNIYPYIYSFKTSPHTYMITSMESRLRLGTCRSQGRTAKFQPTSVLPIPAVCMEPLCDHFQKVAPWYILVSVFHQTDCHRTVLYVGISQHAHVIILLVRFSPL